VARPNHGSPGSRGCRAVDTVPSFCPLVTASRPAQNNDRQRKCPLLRVNFSGKQFAVVFKGKELFTAEDETHKDAGKVGVWTKADRVTLFDDFSYGAK
jgi:hypothetical protein